MSDEKKTGRPTKYNDKVQAEADRYVEDCGDDGVPSVAGLCRRLKVHRDTLYEWGRVHPIFSDTLKSIKDEQERLLIARGLTNDFNASLAKLLLSNHGYSEKQAVEHSGAMTTHAVSYSAEDYKAARKELEKRME